MEYEVATNALAKQFLDDYLTEDMQRIFYENCTNMEQTKIFQHYLLGHLIDTGRLLKKWGCSEALYLAGIFHSIYGTEALSASVFTFSPLSLEHREKISTVIGAKTEHLVYLFCAMTKDTFFSNLARQTTFSVFDRFNRMEIPISESDYIDLLSLTLADWIEPIVGKEADPRTAQYLKSLFQKEFTQASYLLPTQAVEDFRQAYAIEPLTP